eukprot:scaffold38451_cov41-Cyclotella_meneghiniana.AAC.2
MATRRSSNIHSLAESSFIDSLAHLSRSQSRSKSQSRTPSTNHDKESSNEIKGRASLHRQENSDAPPSEGGRYSRSTTPMAGITKTHEHEVAKSSTVPEERVSFTRSQSQDTKNNHDYLSTPNSHAFATRPRRSLRDSPRWPPPPPPRRTINCVPSTTIPSTRKQRKDLSEVLQPSQTTILPFPTARSDGSRTALRLHRSGGRRRSMLDMEELGDRGAPSPPLPILNRRRSDGDGIFVSPHQEIKEHSHVSSNQLDYELGDLPRCLSHVIIDTSPQAALERVSRLNPHDCAFVKRSNKSWSYAILASRFVDIYNEEHMVFALDEKGLTKDIKRSQWASCVRCVATIVTEGHEGVPKTISINNDDCSLISSIS